MLQFKQLQATTDGRFLQVFEDRPVLHLIIDSRKLLISTEALFFAVAGARHDGHVYIEELYHKGIRQFVVEKPVDLEAIPEANVIQVNDSILALQQIASHHRNLFDLTVVAITGSNGKTIVKEWLGQMLSTKLKVVKSPKSYNSQIGVPLSLWQIRPEHEIGIFEAGISQVGEMQKLADIIKPQIGIFTMVGTAHDEGFENRHHKILEKSKLFEHVDKLIYCRDHHDVHELFVKKFNQKELINWGRLENSTIQIKRLKKLAHDAELTLLYEGRKITFAFPFSSEASIENCMHCVAFLLSESFTPAFIQQQINLLDNVSKRLELKQGINGCYLIDDTYNNDFGGLQIALDFMGQQKHNENKTVVLSDLLQTGLNEQVLYKSIGELLHNKGIKRLIGVGKAISKNSAFFKMPAVFYNSTEEFLNHANKSDFHDELVLVKGARHFYFERIVELLQQKNHGTVLEINLDALTHNLNFYRSKLSPRTKLMVMVKAFAYGSGSDEVANLLQFHRVDYLAVAYTDEGVALREHGISLPIMVMNTSSESFGQLIRYNLEPEVYSLAQLKALANFLREANKTIHIHLKLDTGMHRLGFNKHELPNVLEYLANNPAISVSSVFSHLAGADEALHNDFSHHQVKRFIEMKNYLSQNSDIKPLYHILNSAGIVRFPDYQFDMVRLGIGLYGVEASGQEQDQLLPISTLKTTISQIKHIAKGETVGYSRKGVATRDTLLATIAIGYADGFDRRFGQGKGQVYINGQLAPVVGNVCMDMTMVDVTGIEAAEGDEVIIFGKEIPITKLASAIGTIPYEILTNVSERVKRIFFTE